MASIALRWFAVTLVATILMQATTALDQGTCSTINMHNTTSIALHDDGVRPAPFSHPLFAETTTGTSRSFLDSSGISGTATWVKVVVLVVIVVLIIIIVLLIVLLCCCTTRLNFTNSGIEDNKASHDEKRAPKNEEEPITLILFEIAQCVPLWAIAPMEMKTILPTYYKMVRSAIVKHKCYEVKCIADVILVATASPLAALQLAADVQRRCHAFTKWNCPVVMETYAKSDVKKKPAPPPPKPKPKKKEKKKKHGSDSDSSSSHLSKEDEEGSEPSRPPTPIPEGDPFNGPRIKISIYTDMATINKMEGGLGYDYTGEVLVNVCRIGLLCRGGQILFAESTHDEIDSFEDAKLNVINLGAQYLRGRRASVELFELVALRQREFPRLRTQQNMAKVEEDFPTALTMLSTMEEYPKHRSESTYRALTTYYSTFPPKERMQLMGLHCYNYFLPGGDRKHFETDEAYAAALQDVLARRTAKILHYRDEYGDSDEPSYDEEEDSSDQDSEEDEEDEDEEESSSPSDSSDSGRKHKKHNSKHSKKKKKGSSSSSDDAKPLPLSSSTDDEKEGASKSKKKKKKEKTRETANRSPARKVDETTADEKPVEVGRRGSVASASSRTSKKSARSNKGKSVDVKKLKKKFKSSAKRPHSVAAFLHGRPTMLGDSITPCFTSGNGLLFRIVDTSTKKWAFYNDTTEFQMHVYFSLGKSSCVIPVGRTKLQQNPETQRFEGDLWIAPLCTEVMVIGAVNGFKFSYDAVPAAAAPKRDGEE